MGFKTKDKIFDINSLNSKLTALHKSKQRIGLCHGVFDLLHRDHIELFEQAKEKCDILVVGIDSRAF